MHSSQLITVPVNQYEVRMSAIFCLRQSLFSVQLSRKGLQWFLLHEQVLWFPVVILVSSGYLVSRWLSWFPGGYLGFQWSILVSSGYLGFQWLSWFPVVILVSRCYPWFPVVILVSSGIIVTVTSKAPPGRHNTLRAQNGALSLTKVCRLM